MATLAAFFRREEAVAAAPAARAQSTDACRLRPIPNEDVYFFLKRIDNSRLVRQADPRAGRKGWRAIGAVSMVTVLLLLLLAPAALGVMAGYRIHALKAEQQRLLDERVALELEESRLLSPKRLEELARTLEFVDPAPQQVVLLNPEAGGSLALNVGKK